MKRLIQFLLIIISSFLCAQTYSQEVIIDTEFGIEPIFSDKDVNGDVVISAMTVDTALFWSSLIIKVTPELDTTIRYIYDTLNDLFAPRILVTQNNNYILNILERLGGSGNTDHLVITVYDENLNQLSFNRYDMSPVNIGVNMNFIQNENGRIYGFGGRGDWDNYIVMEINEMGDTLKTHLIETTYGTTLYSGVMESHYDSIALHSFVMGFDNSSYWKIFTVDTAFNYSYSDIEFSDGYGAKIPMANWLNDSIYMGIGHVMESASSRDLMVYKANANQNHAIVGDYLWIHRQDTIDSPAMGSPSFVDSEYIYLGAWGETMPWSAYDGRYMVCIVDSDLNIKGMKSFGKEGFHYDLYTLQATDDLGCVLSGVVNDYQNSTPEDWDLFIRKIMPNDIVSVAEETASEDDSDYFIYPNPGTDLLHINTTRKGVQLQIMDMKGKILLHTKLENKFTNTVDVKDLSTGTYVVKFTDEKSYSESIQWIKIKNK
jgi:hypothetical protein